jgi:hypothetical protein
MKKISISLIVLMVWIFASGAAYAQQERVLRVSQASTAPHTLDPHKISLGRSANILSIEILMEG